MAISVNWITKVIFVPKADTTLVQSSPTEIRELDLNTFRLTLGDLKDDVDGRVWEKIFDHYTTISISGIELAHALIILPPYTVTFEDGQWACNLIGANSNVADRTNVNQVSIRSANSAGLAQMRAIEYTSFSGGCSINTLTGIDTNNGSKQYPVKTFTRAIEVCEYRGFDTIFILGDLTLANGDSIAGYNIKGTDRDSGTLTLEDGCITTAANVYDLTIVGYCGGRMNIHNCHMMNIYRLCASGGNANIISTHFMGNIQFNDVADMMFYMKDCSGAIGMDKPVFDVNGCSAAIHFDGWSGPMTLENATHASTNIRIDGKTFDVTVDASCIVDDSIMICGIGGLVNNAARTVVDISKLVSLEDVRFASFGNAVNIDIENVTGNAISGTAFPAGSKGHPTDNMSSAISIIGNEGFRELFLYSTATIGAESSALAGFMIRGANKLTCTANLQPAAVLDNCILRDLRVNGTLDSNTYILDCIVDNLDWVEGDLHGCEVEGTLVVKGTNGLEVFNCYSGRKGTSDPAIIDMDGPITGSKNVAIHNWSGHMKIKNMTGGILGISINSSAHIKIESSCTGGMIHIMGNAKIIDQSAGTDVRLNYILTPSAIASAVLSSLISGTTTLQDMINELHDAMPRQLGLMMENHVEDDIVRDGNGNKTSSIFYLYDTKANALAHDKATGLIATYSVDINYTADDVDLFRVVKN